MGISCNPLNEIPPPSFTSLQSIFWNRFLLEPCDDFHGGVEVSDAPAVEGQPYDTGQNGFTVLVGGLGYQELGHPRADLISS